MLYHKVQLNFFTRCIMPRSVIQSDKKHEKPYISLFSTFCYPFSYFVDFSRFFRQMKFCRCQFQRYFARVNFHKREILRYFAQIIFCGKDRYPLDPRNISLRKLIHLRQIHEFNLDTFTLNPLMLIYIKPTYVPSLMLIFGYRDHSFSTYEKLSFLTS